MSARQHQGSVQQQLEALDRALLEANNKISFVVAALGDVLAGEPASGVQPEQWPPAGYPPSPRTVRRHGLRLVRGGAR